MSAQIIEHFYRETASRLNGYVRQSFRRQAGQVKQHMGNVMRDHGPQELTEMMRNLAEFSDSYPGGQENIFSGEIFTAIGELREAGYEPGTADYREQLAYMVYEKLFTKAEYDRNQDAPSREQQATASLNEALQHQKSKLARAAGPY
jgi:hypothetical protein